MGRWYYAETASDSTQSGDKAEACQFSHKGICSYSTVRCQRRCQLLNTEPPVMQVDSAHICRHSSKVVIRPGAVVQRSSLTGPNGRPLARSGGTQHIFASAGLMPVTGAPLERGLAIRSCPFGPNSSDVLDRAPYRDDAKGKGQTTHEGIPEEAFPWMAAMGAAGLRAERATN